MIRRRNRLSTVAELGRVLTPENVAEVLPRFFGLSHREAEALSASLRPARVIPTRDVVKLLPSVSSRPAPYAVPVSQPAIPAPPLPEPSSALALGFRTSFLRAVARHSGAGIEPSAAPDEAILSSGCDRS